MEGVSSEAASLAGHLGLGKLICLYDDNHITIDGGTELSFTEDVAKRFTAYGWQVLKVRDGNDLEAHPAGVRGRPGRDGQTLAHRLPHPHRLRQPEQAGLARGPRRAAGRGRGRG